LKKLYLVRHAKSSWKNPELNDYERPLNKRGKRDAPFMGNLINEKGITPDLIISSTAKRAYETAKYFAGEMKYPLEKIKTDKNLYEAGVNDILSVLSKTESNIETLMLFSHNPGLTDFSNFISNERIENIPTSAVVSLKLNVKHWKEIGEQSCELEFFEYPKRYFK
jgi:phosphohistidine phosphatase